VRTTLTVDDDVLLAVQERARREKRSVGSVLSELARQAINGPAAPAVAAGRHGFTPLPRRGPVVSNEVIDRLRDDEVE